MKQIVGYIFEEKYYCVDCTDKGKPIYDTDEAPKEGISCSECGDDILEPDEDYCKFERFLTKGFEVNGWRDVFDNEYNEWDIEGDTYKVITNEEADEECRQDIVDTIWTFNYEFLAQHSECISLIPVEAFKVLQEQCEAMNDSILAMIDDLDHFVEEAILADGRGHFIGQHDEEEHELGEFEGKEYYAYRVA